MQKMLLACVLSVAVFSCSQLTEVIPLTVDKKLGESVTEQLKNSPNFTILDSVKNAPVYNYIEEVRDKILTSDDIKYKKEFSYDVTIINDTNTLNAFVTPGGQIYVYTALIKFLDSESEMAGVLAHEIAHAENRHSVIQMASQVGTSLLISLVLNGDYSQLLNMGAKLLFLKFSRSDEKEADEYAVQYLNDTEYDPRGVAGFFQKMIKEEKDAKVPAFLSTHPASQDRIEDILQKWKELGSKEGEKGIQRHKKVVNFLIKQEAAIQ